MRCLTSKHSSFHLNFISGWKNYCAYNFYAFKTHYICSCNIKSFVCLGVQKKISKRAAFLRFAFCFDFSSVFDHNVKFYRYIKDLWRLKCKIWIQLHWIYFESSLYVVSYISKIQMIRNCLNTINLVMIL